MPVCILFRNNFKKTIINGHCHLKYINYTYSILLMKNEIDRVNMFQVQN